jgi:hypothetical protein
LEVEIKSGRCRRWEKNRKLHHSWELVVTRGGRVVLGGRGSRWSCITVGGGGEDGDEAVVSLLAVGVWKQESGPWMKRKARQNMKLKQLGGGDESRRGVLA